MAVTPIRFIGLNDYKERPATYNRALGDALTGSGGGGYLADGSDYAGWAKTVHSHAISDTTGLQAALDAKATVGASYTKAEGDARFAPLSHTHDASTLTGTVLAAGIVTSSLTVVGILAAPHMTAPVVDSGGLTVTLGGITASAGNITLGGSGYVSGPELRLAGNSYNRVATSDSGGGFVSGYNTMYASGVLRDSTGAGGATYYPAVGGVRLYAGASAAAGSALSLVATFLSTGITFGVGLTVSTGGLAISAGGLAVTGNLGLFGTAATTKQTVSGSRGANAALASLLTALAAYGLVTDSTTA